MVLVYLLWLLHGSGGLTQEMSVKVNAIERNTCHDDRGNDCFTQYIFWEYLPYLSKHGVVAWVMEDKAEIPFKHGDHYWTRVHVGERVIVVRADSFVQSRTHTSQDPERKNKMVWPEKMRRGLK